MDKTKSCLTLLFATVCYTASKANIFNVILVAPPKQMTSWGLFCLVSLFFLLNKRSLFYYWCLLCFLAWPGQAKQGGRQNQHSLFPVPHGWACTEKEGGSHSANTTAVEMPLNWCWLHQGHLCMAHHLHFLSGPYANFNQFSYFMKKIRKIKKGALFNRVWRVEIQTIMVWIKMSVKLQFVVLQGLQCFMVNQ